MHRRTRSLFLAVAVMAGGALGPALAAVAVRSTPATPAPGGSRSAADATPAAGATAAAAGAGAARLAEVGAAPAEGLKAIATFGGVRPTTAQLSALRALGLRVQPLRRLPMALLAGTKAQLQAAAERRLATDVWPDERIEYHWTTSNATMTADVAQAAGYTGKGVTVAVVDSGIDATHADLADHVVHNVKLVGAEYANQHPTPEGGPNYVVVPVESSPYNNSDLGSGHGTHVAGIIAADGHTSPEQVGVAPDAELVGYSIGEVALTTAVVSAYDHILDHPDWGIDVVNNSWGNSWHDWEPEHPIHVATKAVADTGVVVVFSAGNSGDEQTEMTLNPWSSPPWVISVAAGTVSKERSSFSSNGLEHDNSLGEPLVEGDDGVRHAHFDGDRIGFYHPDITAPGSDIDSSATPTGAYAGPTPPSGTTIASGTSMSGPHIAGAAAVLLSANPKLSPEQVRQALTSTAVPLSDGSPFWQAGYGYADLGAAVELVTQSRAPRAIRKAQAAADKRVLKEREWSVNSSDLWGWDSPPATVGGVPDSRSFSIDVPEGTGAVKLVVEYPALHGISNNADYSLALLDAEGNEVPGQHKLSGVSGVTSLFVDLTHPTEDEEGNEVPVPEVAFGTWTIEVSGNAGASDPDTLDSDSVLGRVVNLQAALLDFQGGGAGGPGFVPGGTTTLFLQPDGATPLVSPEGCQVEEGAPEGGLAPTLEGDECHSGQVGYAVSRLADVRATFTSAPLEDDLVVGDAATLTLHLADGAYPAYSSAGFTGTAFYYLDAVDAEGEVVQAVASGQIADPAVAGANQLGFEVPPTAVPAGTSLRLQLQVSSSPLGAPSSTARLLYGGGDYADSGLTLTTGTIQ